MHPSTLCLGLAALAGCVEPVDNPAENVFSARVQEVVLEVDYQHGAEPWTGTLLHNHRAWDLVVANIAALFDQGPAPRRLVIPTALEQMQPIALPPTQGFTREQIWDIAQRHRDDSSSEVRRVFYVVFLDGYLMEEGELQPHILGLSLRGRGVVAMFAPVTRGTSRLAEQTGLVHELGHAMGLVDLGGDLTTAHHDEEASGHCLNPSCVMYRVNRDSLLKPVYREKVAHGKPPVLFCDPCLSDVGLATTLADP